MAYGKTIREKVIWLVVVSFVGCTVTIEPIKPTTKPRHKTGKKHTTSQKAKPTPTPKPTILLPPDPRLNDIIRQMKP
jgi:hypothetical protein